MVRKYLFSVLCILCFKVYAVSGITNSTKCGRLGDQLVEVAECFWISNKYQLPFYLTPFKNSDQFCFHHSLPKRPRGAKEVHIHKEEYESLSKENNVLYVYNLNPLDKQKTLNFRVHFDLFDWKEPEFLKIIRSMFSPVKKVDVLSLPDDRISIAIHVRTGGNYDKTNSKKLLAKKFTSIPFVIESVYRLDQYFNGAPLYIHIFTDDPDPDAILKKIASQVPQENIQWGIKHHKGHQEALFHDLYSMTKFDALIASGSNFSFIAWVLGDHLITYRQSKAHYDNGQIIVDDYEVVDNRGNPIAPTASIRSLGG